MNYYIFDLIKVLHITISMHTFNFFCENDLRVNLKILNYTQNYANLLSPHMHIVEKAKTLLSVTTYLRQRNISFNQLFSNFFSKNVAFTKFLPKHVRIESVVFTHTLSPATGKSVKLTDVSVTVKKKMEFFS